MAGRHQRRGFGFDGIFVLALQRFLQLFDSGFNGFFLGRFQLVTVLAQALLHAVHRRLTLVAGLNQFQLFLVFGRVDFCVLDHLLDFFFRQTRVGLDGDLVFFARAFVLGADVQDAVGVDVKSHLDLRHTTRCGRDAFQVELTQGLVARSHLALALEDLDGHGRLVVVGRGEGLGKPGRDGGVLGDHLGHDTAQGFNAQGQRGHVQQQHVGAVTGQHLALHRSAHGHGFVGVHVLAWFAAKELFDLVLHLGHAGHATHQNHVLDVRHAQARILDGGAAGRNGALDQVINQAFQLGARELQVQVLGARRIGRDVGQVDVGLGGVGQLNLGFFSGFLQALQGQHVLGQVHALLFFELANDVVDDALVKVFTAQEGVAVGGQHFKLLFAVHIGNFDDGHVKRAAAQVVHGNLAVALACFVQAKSQGRRGGFVDDALDFQASDAASILGGLALGIVEVGGHGDHGLGHFFAQEVLGGFLHFAQHFSRNLRRCQLLVAHLHPGIAVVGLDDLEGGQVQVFLNFFFVKLAANQTLGRKDGVARVGHGLALGRSTHQNFTVFLVSDDRRRGAGTLAVFNHAGGVAFHDGHAAVGGAQVDTDNFCHFE